MKRPSARTLGRFFLSLGKRTERSPGKCQPSKSQHSLNGYGLLRAVLEEARHKAGCGLGDVTVLSAQVDPYRLDTPSGHRDGAWLAKQLDRAIGKKRRIHWRGVFYVLVAGGNIVKPNGELFVNNDENWTWLANVAGKAARWLGYIPFERITDNRNAEPLIHHKASVAPQTFVSIGLDVTVPDADDIEPKPIAVGFEPRQAFHFVTFGEKASLEDVLLPIARAKQADLYLPTGEISDTLLYRIAKDADDDGRPLVVFTLTDCDPAGHQMSVSIGRKLQALRDLLFPELRFEVVPVALTVEQVRELGLPSTPLKETEKRADRWREAFGVEQTEIDALATLQPNVLREIVERVFRPVLRSHIGNARQRSRGGLESAGRGSAHRADRSRAPRRAANRGGRKAFRVRRRNRQYQRATPPGDRGSFRAAGHQVPEPEVDEDAPRLALVRFDDGWAAATRALIQRKAYGNGGG
jgi:hypothetical protein